MNKYEESFVFCKVWINKFFADFTVLIDLEYIWTELQLQVSVKDNRIRRSSVLEVPQLIAFVYLLALLDSGETTWYLYHSYFNNSQASVWPIVDPNHIDVSGRSHGQHLLRIYVIFYPSIELFSYRQFRVWHEVRSFPKLVGFDNCSWDGSVPSMIEIGLKIGLINSTSDKMFVNYFFHVWSFLDSEHVVKRVVVVFEPETAFSLSIESGVLSVLFRWKIKRLRIWTVHNYIFSLIDRPYFRFNWSCK